jgi:transcriptional regulator with XRE-family HTH domain
MSTGYSQDLIQANKDASARSLGVALGRHCIKHRISAKQVADKFGVSRMTVYLWFKGQGSPNLTHAKEIQRYLKRFK